MDCGVELICRWYKWGFEDCMALHIHVPHQISTVFTIHYSQCRTDNLHWIWESQDVHGGWSVPLYSYRRAPSPWHLGFLGLPFTMTTSPGHSLTILWTMLTNSRPLSEWRIRGTPIVAKTRSCRLRATSWAVLCIRGNRMCSFDQWSI